MQAIMLALIAGVVATTILLIFSGPILRAMGASGELFDQALIYLRIRAFAGPAVLLVTAGHGAFRGYQETKTPVVVTLILNVVNLILDPLFIFGFGWGIAGAAWATVVAQWTGALLFLGYLLVWKREELGIRIVIPMLRELLPFLKIGWELAIRTFALIGTMTIATAVATRVGVTAVAAHQVAAQLWMFMALIVDALAVSAQALVRATSANRSLGSRAPCLIGCSSSDLPSVSSSPAPSLSHPRSFPTFFQTTRPSSPSSYPSSPSSLSCSR